MFTVIALGVCAPIIQSSILPLLVGCGHGPVDRSCIPPVGQGGCADGMKWPSVILTLPQGSWEAGTTIIKIVCMSNKKFMC